MKTVTSIKLDTDLKEEASKLASQMGLTLSSVVNATLRKFVAERRVVFSLAPEFNAKTKREILKMKRDVKHRKNIVGPFDSFEDMEDSLMK